jgi:hypothetical protein
MRIKKGALMEPTQERVNADPTRHRGPSLVVVATVYAILTLAAVIAPTVIAGGRHFPSPFDPEAPRWFAENPATTLASSFLLFCAAVPLGIFTGSVSSRLQFLGMKVAGIHIALTGGIAASVALATSAFAQWALAQPGVAESAAAARVLHSFAFAAGGPGFVVPFGLLVAGIAVVAGLQAFVPRWFMTVGLVLAAIAELSVFALVSQGAAFLLPIGRFLGLVWLIAAGWLLPKSRAARGGSVRASPRPMMQPDAVEGGHA